MNMQEVLRALAAGKRPVRGLLQTCRMEAFGSEFYGEEAIVEALRSAPFTISADAIWVDAAGHLCMIDGEAALIADIAEGGIGRLWRLGGGAPAVREPRIDVAFDPDLLQARDDVFLALSDHPSLAADAADGVVAIGRSLARDWPAEPGRAPYRARAFAIRAFGDAASGAALFAVYRLGPGNVRTAGFTLAAIVWQGERQTIVRDRAGEAASIEPAWSPRIGS